jgi:predicted RNase H-like HicB family nuclease
VKGYNSTIILEREEDGGYHTFCSALPGCHTQGNTYEEAIENIKEAVKLNI